MSVSTSNRRGSALLIVLGFLSFMVVSAVAFAVFMRAERAPSSALRRNVAVRHLVKGALARAISILDDAIRGDTFPGRAGSGSPDGQPYRDRSQNPMDVWQGRVFMPPDPEGGTDPGRAESRFAPVTETASVLNLEALGYLPPPLVNDVRFLARCSWSSKWQNLPYDSGRCAYVAVNVSDYFDINRLRANQGRSSNDGSRIGLASVFRDSNGNRVDTAATRKFDELVHDNRVTDSGGARNSMPYTSMLDYNLALGFQHQVSGFGGGYNSPWWTWIKNPQNGLMYQTLATNGNANAEFAKRQTFITDSWFPVAREGAGQANNTNLLYDTAQPFPQREIRKGTDCAAVEPMTCQSNFKTVMQYNRHYLNLTDWITLYDYLDRDDVPLTLVQPSVERIPMVTGLAPSFNNFTFKCSVEKTTTTDPATPLPGQPYKQITTYTTKFKQDSFPSDAAVNALLAFPFKRGSDLNNGSSFKARALMRLFLVASPNAEAAPLPVRGSGVLRNMRPKFDEWKNSSTQPYELKRGGDTCAVLTFTSTEKQLNLPNRVTEEEDAFVDPNGTRITLSRPNAGDKVFFTRTETVQMSASGTQQGEKQVSWEFPEGCAPLLADGSVLPSSTTDDYMNYTIRPCAAIWFKIETPEGVVDYVPAVLNDDYELGGVDNRMLASVGAAKTNHGPDTDRGTEDVDAPLLRMMGSSAIQFQTILAAATAGPADFTDPNGQMQFTPKAFFAVDPRFNWAPEDWVERTDADIQANAWLGLVRPLLQTDGRDPDIFMGYSNQGYLQSMGEIFMLPRQTDDSGATINVSGQFDGQPRTDPEQIAHAQVAWRTYPADYEVSNAEDKLFANKEHGPDAIISDGPGFRVNPYTDNLQIMRTAIACTPCDWWAAGTNNTQVCEGNGANKSTAAIKDKIMEDAQEALKYAYCEDNPEAQLASEDVDWIASYILQQIQAQPTRKWEEVFDELPWRGVSGEEDRLFGHDLRNGVTLHNVDRKFLYAFWRGCFANKQQLFLIFVRAESNALGGPGEGTPAQQGGRAVALVWRDPDQDPNLSDYRDNDTNFQSRRRPHRTRVLFYHQFE